MFEGLETSLQEVHLSHNKLGDNLSPVLKTKEFSKLEKLRNLDLSYNGLRGIAENLIKGCKELKVSLVLSKLIYYIFFFFNIRFHLRVKSVW